jgi:glycosyltransferase involved in cell wall biosynthesis
MLHLGPHGPPGAVVAAPARQALRILLVLEAAGGGAGRHVLDLAGELVRHGHVVHLAWSPIRAEPAFTAALRRTAGLILHAVPMHRAPGPRDAASVRTLRRLLAGSGPFDIAHGHSSKAGALIRLAAIGSGVPVVYTPHAFVTLDPSLREPLRTAYRIAERALAHFGERIICVSAEERVHALALGIAAARLRVVPNGIAPLPPVDRAEQRRRLGLADDEACVGFVGRLSGQKAVGRLVAAFALMAPDHPRARLVLVGEGPEQALLEGQVRALGIGPRVLFVGQGDGPVLMAAFDVFALPSRYEAFSYALLEAAARGVPIVATAAGGVSAVVRPGENGYVVPQADAVPGMAARLGELLADSALRERLGRRSLELAAGFGVGAMGERTVAVYREVARPVVASVQ